MWEKVVLENLFARRQVTLEGRRGVSLGLTGTGQADGRKMAAVSLSSATYFRAVSSRGRDQGSDHDRDWTD